MATIGICRCTDSVYERADDPGKIRSEGTCMTGAAAREGEQTKAEPRVAQLTVIKSKAEKNKEKREKRKLMKASANNQGMQNERWRQKRRV